jgi:Uma2 family endonuclease
MTPTTTGRLLTADEFRQLPDPPDGSRQELVRGVVITMPPPGFRHGKVQCKVGRLIGNFLDAHPLGHVVTESGVRTEAGPDTVRGPDVSFWSFERLPADAAPDGYPEVAPDLVVEVRSPGQSRPKLRDKIKEYLFNGVRVVWVADPEDRTVTIYRQPDEGRELGESARLTDDVLPGFACRVGDIFPAA